MNLLTPTQVAQAAQLSEGTVLRLCRERRLPGAKKIGGTWRIVEERFVAWLAEDDTVEEPRPARHLATTIESEGRW